MMSTSLYQAREFAARSGVTVRTLHHYDRLGLLKPTLYSEAGYRLYSDRDFARLQQIVTLKFIGLPLKQIKELLDGDLFDLARLLRMQRELMERQRSRLDVAIQAITEAERVAESGDEPDGETFRQIIEVITMESNKEMFQKYYTEEQLAELGRRWESEKESIEQTQRDWAELIKEVEGALGEDPGSEKAQALAARWTQLVERFTLGDPGVTEGLNKFWADKPNWPATFRKPFSDEVGEFIRKAGEIRKQQES